MQNNPLPKDDGRSEERKPELKLVVNNLSPKISPSAPDLALASFPARSAHFSFVDKLLHEHYPLGTVTDSKKLTGGVVNDSYIFRTKETDGSSKQYFLRRYAPNKDLNLVNFEHSVLSHLSKHGFYCSAELIKTKSGGTYFEGPDEQGRSRVYMLTSVLPGEDKYAHESNDLLPSELQSVGQVFARYHTIISTLDNGIYRPQHKPLRARMLDDIEVKIADIPRMLKALEGMDSETVKTFKHYWPQIQPIIENIKIDLSQAHYKLLPHLPIHRDLHPGNMRFQNGKVSGMFDFDYCKIDARALDVGMSALFLSTRWSDSPAIDGKVDLQRLSAFLQAYHEPNNFSHPGGLGGLNALEKQALPAMMQISNALLVHWFLNDFYERSKSGTPDGTKKIDAEYARCLRHRMTTTTSIEENKAEIAKILSEL